MPQDVSALDQHPRGKGRKIVEVIQQGLRVQARHPAPLGAKGHKHHRHPCGKAGLAVRLGITDQHRARHVAAHPLHCGKIGRRVRLAGGQGVGPDQGAKQIAYPEPAGQGFRKTGGFVGADRHSKPVAPQSLNRRDSTGVKSGVHIYRLGIGAQQHRVLRIDSRLVTEALPRQAQPRKAQTQHRPPPMKRRQAVASMQHIAVPQPTETGVRCRQQIGTGVGKRAIQIKNHRRGAVCMHFVTLREGTTPCGPVLWG